MIPEKQRKVKGKPVLFHGLRMNAIHDFGKEIVVIGATAAFSCKTDFCGVVFEDIQRHMTHN
ncbi:MAG: hypothetical protein IKS21_04310, partial [Oscillospiraceae bacterium]|nr:hypothetical protein [Oscillospiraceae bacterium]